MGKLSLQELESLEAFLIGQKDFLVEYPITSDSTRSLSSEISDMLEEIEHDIYSLRAEAFVASIRENMESCPLFQKWREDS